MELFNTIRAFAQPNITKKCRIGLPPTRRKTIPASRTSILIAHRLSTILAADEILVVRDGEIVERGQHRDLVRAGGTYQELYETQFRIEKREGE